MISSAPLAFTIVCALSISLAWLVADRVYRQRLSAQNELLGYYREKLGLAPANKTRYSAMRNAELRRDALALAAEIRRSIPPPPIESTREVLEGQREMMLAQTDEERTAIWLKRTGEAATRYAHHNNQILAMYSQQFKADVILLRDEMLLRLPSEARDRFKLHPEEDPVNYLRLMTVPDKLEQIAKLLPEQR